MKKIGIPYRAGLKIHLKENVETEMFNSEQFERLKIFRKRARGIVQSCHDVEEYLKEIIARLLFNEIKGNKDFIEGILLDSDFCTFSSKRKILKSCLSHYDLLKGKDKSELDKCLSKVMKCRNSFAHGVIKQNGNIFNLHYFEGEIQIKLLNEKYWDEIIDILEKAFKLLDNLELVVDNAVSDT